jgi:DNA-binding NtrC family response regulator
MQYSSIGAAGAADCQSTANEKVEEKVVLLAEDDTAVRTLAALALQAEHLYVLQACNGEEALRVARTHDNIDLVLTDVEMGAGLNGIDLRSRILAERPGLPVLVMSGFSENESMAAEKGIPFLAKPFTFANLRQRVREVLAFKIPAQSETSTKLRQTTTDQTGDA